MSADADTDTTLATVAGNLYGALMDARRFVNMDVAYLRAAGYATQAERRADCLDRVDAVLAEAADYVQGE